MAKKLKKLKITAVALCEEGCNSSAHIKLYKTKEDVTKVKYKGELSKDDFRSKIGKKLRELNNEDYIYICEMYDEHVIYEVEYYINHNYISKKYVINYTLNGEEIELNRESIKEVDLIWENKEEGVVKVKKLEEILRGLPQEEQDTINAELAKIENNKEVVKLKGEIEDLKKSKEPVVEEPKSDDEILKSLDPVVRDMVVKAREELAKERAKAELAQEVAKKLKEEKVDEELTKSVENLNGIGVEKEVLKSILKFTSTNEEVHKSLLSSLDSIQSKLTDSTIFKALGSDEEPSTGNLNNGKVEDLLISKAKEIQSVKKCTMSEAYREALNANQDLCDSYTNYK